MADVASIAISGMRAAQTRLQASAHNIANVQTPALRRLQVDSASAEGGGVVATVSLGPVDAGSLESDLVQQMQARHGFMASLAVFSASDRMMGALLDAHA